MIESKKYKLSDAIDVALATDYIQTPELIDISASKENDGIFLIYDIHGEELAQISTEEIREFKNSGKPNVYSEIKDLQEKSDELTGMQKAYILRLKDTKGGYALAHIIPFVGIYYAITRRTITPFLYWFITSQAISLIGYLLLYISGAGVSTINIYENSFTLFNLIAIPILAGIGIDKARKRAIFKLNNQDKQEFKVNVLNSFLNKIQKKLTRFQKKYSYIFTNIKELTYKLIHNSSSLFVHLYKSFLLPLKSNFVSTPIKKKIKNINELKELYENGTLTKLEYESLRKKELGL